MNISKLKAGWSLLTGGVAGLITYSLELFNEQVLAKADPETLKKYCADTIAVANALKAILDNHAADLDDKRKAALTKTVEAVNGLADALADAKVTQEELDKMVEDVKAAIAAWKEAQ